MEIEFKKQNGHRFARLDKKAFCRDCSKEIDEGCEAYFCRECRSVFCTDSSCIHFHETDSVRMLFEVQEVDA